MARITIAARVPDDVVKLFLQHIRDFDVVQPDCEFTVLATTDLTADELEKAIASVTPPFKHRRVLRKQP